MIARAAGDSTATVSQFWDNKSGATRNGFSSTVSFSYSGKLESTDFKSVSGSVPRLINSFGPSPAISALQSGPVMIGGSISYSGGTEAHWMLGIAVDGSKIIANDPWTGTKVKIETQGPNAGKVTDIMDPKSGVFFSYSSVVSDPNLKNEFDSLPKDTSGNPSYAALGSFNAGAQDGGYIAVTIR